MISIEKDYLQTVIKRFKYYKSLADKIFEALAETELHFQPDIESNSIATIIHHITGNMMSRWTNFLTEDGEKEWRQRDAEFEPTKFDKTQLLKLWEEGWDCMLNVITALDEADLSKTVYIRKEPLTVIDAINRQLAHYPYHIGQIVYLGRMIRKEKWVSLSIPKGGSDNYNKGAQIKDPAKNFEPPAN